MMRFFTLIFVLLLMVTPFWTSALAVEGEEETETVKKEKEQVRESEKQRAEVERKMKKDRIEEEKTMRRTAREEKKQEMETVREQQKMLLNVEESSITDKVAKKAHPRFDMLFTRMMEHATRIEQLIERIQSRVSMVESEGTDTSEVTVLVDQASNNITTAKQQLDSLQTTYEGSVGSQDPKTALQSVHEGLKEVRQYMQDAHGQIRKAITLLKSLVKAPDAVVSPTTGPTVTPTL